MSLLAALDGHRIYLDTNVFIYALEGFAGLESELRTLFKAMERGGFNGYTSELTLAEALVKPLQTSDTSLLTAYDHMFPNRLYFETIPVKRVILRETARLRGKHALKAIRCHPCSNGRELGVYDIDNQ